MYTARGSKIFIDTIFRKCIFLDFKVLPLSDIETLFVIINDSQPQTLIVFIDRTLILILHDNNEAPGICRHYWSIGGNRAHKWTGFKFK